MFSVFGGMGFSGRSFILLSCWSFQHESILPHIRKSKTVLDSGFHAVDSGLQVLDSGFYVGGPWIPDSNTVDSR